jgi:hypothetical protein
LLSRIGWGDRIKESFTVKMVRNRLPGFGAGAADPSVSGNEGPEVQQKEKQYDYVPYFSHYRHSRPPAFFLSYFDKVKIIP